MRAFLRPQSGESMLSNRSRRNKRNRSTFIPLANHLLNTTEKGRETNRHMSTMVIYDSLGIANDEGIEIKPD
jgi:hypothetical protein